VSREKETALPKRHRRRTPARPTALLLAAALAGAAVAYLGWSATAGAAGRFTASSAHTRVAPAAPAPAGAVHPKAAPAPRRARPAAPKPAPKAAPKAAPAAPGAAPAAPKAAPSGGTGAFSGVGAGDPVSWSAFRHQAVSSREAWNDAAQNGRITWDTMLPLWSMHDVVAELPTLNRALRDQTHNPDATVSVSLGQPMFASGDSYTSCARASSPSPSRAQMDAMATAIADLAPNRTAFVRLGWEFNSGYLWKTQDSDAANFVTCWKRWYAAFKAASPNLKVVWNPNSDPSWEFPIDAFWPGKEFVDAAGPDQYAKSDNGRLSDPNQWTGGFPDPTAPGRQVRNPRGINAWAEYVAGKGVPLAVPEWGVQNDGSDWSSADPAFIGQMRTAFQTAAKSATGLAYEDYFDGGDSSDFHCRHSLNDPACDLNPDAARSYANLFGTPYDTA
jgi:hypothetical protein